MKKKSKKEKIGYIIINLLISTASALTTHGIPLFNSNYHYPIISICILLAISITIFSFSFFLGFQLCLFFKKNLPIPIVIITFLIFIFTLVLSFFIYFSHSFAFDTGENKSNQRIFEGKTYTTEILNFYKKKGMDINNMPTTEIYRSTGAKKLIWVNPNFYEYFYFLSTTICVISIGIFLGLMWDLIINFVDKYFVQIKTPVGADL